MSKFDPTPGQPYGECSDCGISLETQADAREHMSATAPGVGLGSSHGVRVTNAPREDRIRRAVSYAVDDAITEAMEDIHRIVERDGATPDELTAALAAYPDFADAYDEWVSA